jgi:Tfp pilus assembly protein PilF
MERVASRARPEVVAMLVRAETRLGRGDVSGTREALEQATNADATLLGAELQLGVLYQQAKMFDAAGDRFRRVLAATPNNVSALNNLAYLLAEQGKSLDEAEPLARKALALAPSSGPVMDTLGWILHLKGQNKLALPLVTDAIRFAPKNAEIQLHAAIVYAATREFRLAVTALKTALQLDPAFDSREDVRQLKKRLTAAGWWK